MNIPAVNHRALKRLHDFTAPDWANVQSTHEAGQQAVKMEAALRLVLLFHSGQPWSDLHTSEWINLQIAAGVEFPVEHATTKMLCSVIREVLGEVV